jgi:DNA-binding NtrC family response regulator
MQNQTVLIIGRHPEMLEKVKSLLQQNGYKSLGVVTDEEAINIFKTNVIEAVVIGGGVEFESRQYFKNEFSKLNPAVKIIDAHPQTVLDDLKKAFTKND